MDIDVRKQSENGVHVIRLRGDLKLGEPVDGLRQACLDLMNDGETRLVVNLSEVPMIDSSGIGVLVRTLTQAKQHGGALKLVNPSHLVREMLEFTGLTEVFDISSVGHALAILGCEHSRQEHYAAAHQ